MDRLGQIATAFVLFAALAALAACSHDEKFHADCIPEAGPCKQGDVALSISPTPVHPMRELEFVVTAPTSSETIKLDLTMPGMAMGANVIALKRGPDGAYKGKGVIVRCPSGQTLWRVSVLDNEKHPASYLIDVRD